MSNLRSRRDLLRALGASAAGAPFASSLFGQGACQNGYNTQRCPMSQEVATAPIKPLFEPTGWKTVMAEITWSIADYQKEAAFYAALMGWKLRSDDGKQAVMDVDDAVTAIFKAAPPAPARWPPTRPRRGRRASGRPGRRARVRRRPASA